MCRLVFVNKTCKKLVTLWNLEFYVISAIVNGSDMANSSYLGGFRCSKITLIGLNALYIVVAFILIGVAAYAKAVAYIVDISVMGAVIACGVFLLIIACVGVVGTTLHHQVTLFFYIIVLFLLFVVQFIVACACLAIGQSQQRSLFQSGWHEAEGLRRKMQRKFDCCGAFSDDQMDVNGTHPPCNLTSECCQNSISPCCTGILLPDEDVAMNISYPCPCNSCWDEVATYVDKAVKAVGGIGLFFSFTEAIGAWVAYRYRNQKNPSANPNQFL